MKKQIIAALFLLAAVLGSVTASAEGEVSFTPISYYGEYGETLDGLYPGTKIFAGTVVTGGTEGDNAFLSLSLYRKYKLEDFSVCALPLNGRTTVYKSELTLPQDLTDCEVRAVFWKDFKDMKPLCSASLCMGKETRLKSIFAGGVPIKDFNADVTQYEYVIPVDSAAAPDITAVPMDGGAKISTAPPTGFPGETVVNVTSPGGFDSQTYTVKYKCDKPVADSITYLFDNATGVKAVFNENLQIGDYIFSDRTNMKITKLDESLAGKFYIQSGLNWKNGAMLAPTWSDPSQQGWYSFNLKRSATVMVAVYEQYAYFEDANNGWEKSTVPSGSSYVSWNEGDSKILDARTLYKKTFTADEGGVTVTMPNAGRNLYPYLVIIDASY